MKYKIKWAVEALTSFANFRTTGYISPTPQTLLPLPEFSLKLVVWEVVDRRLATVLSKSTLLLFSKSAISSLKIHKENSEINSAWSFKNEMCQLHFKSLNNLEKLVNASIYSYPMWN